jgi:epoxyqueuosine reductase
VDTTTNAELKERIRAAALEQGFARVGFAPAGPLPHRDRLERWIAEGMAGGMAYMERTAAVRHRPDLLLPGARSALVAVASCTAREPDPPPPPGHGLVARYARGQDYHRVLRARLARVAGRIQQLAERPVQTRVAVDTSPILERELAAAAGVGFIGKNTMLITPGLGSFTVLGVLLLDLELPPDPRDPVRRCGRCELCLRACPTGALRGPHELDARRCISYLTIEHRGAIDTALRGALLPWVFGCDACQEVCPYNAASLVAPLQRAAGLRPFPPRAGRRTEDGDPELCADSPEAGALDLARLLTLRSGAYRRLVRGRALARVPRRVLVRNAALVAGAGLRAGTGDPSLRALLEPLTAHDDPAVSSASRWALSDGPPRPGEP